MPDTLPAIFFGPGNPINALMQNAYTDASRRIGEDTADRHARTRNEPVRRKTDEQQRQRQQLSHRSG
jgi:hypothetical protein